MSIAKNFRRYAEALALQMPLPFAYALKRLRLARPTTKAGRAARAARKAIRAAAISVRVMYAEPTKRTRLVATAETTWTQLMLQLAPHATEQLMLY